MNTTKYAIRLQPLRQTQLNNSEKKIYLGGIAFDDISLKNAANRIINDAKGNERCVVVTPNAEILGYAMHNSDFASKISAAKYILADGTGVILFSRLMNTPFSNKKICGVELGEKICNIAAQERIPIFFLGGKSDIARKAARNLTEENPGLYIAGYHNGYFHNDKKICSAINQSRARILFVCLGSPYQENWITENLRNLEYIRVALCLGGSLDIYSHEKKRSPVFIQNLGFEWLWRIMCEPSRIKRLPTIVNFLADICREKIFLTCKIYTKALEISKNTVYN